MDGAPFSNNAPTYPVCPLLFVSPREEGEKSAAIKDVEKGDQNVKSPPPLQGVLGFFSFFRDNFIEMFDLGENCLRSCYF